MRDWITASQLNTSTDALERQQSLKSLFDYWKTNAKDILLEMGIAVLKKEYIWQLVNYNYCSMSDLVMQFLKTEKVSN